MGSNKSTLPAPSPKFLKEPWREVNWGKNGDLLNFIENFKISYQNNSDEVSHVHILLYGPVGAGKSSFINSIQTALIGRSGNTAAANAVAESEKSFTVEYKTHTIRKEMPNEFFPFVIDDIMGLVPSKDGGLSSKDIELILKGHMKDGYKFNPVSPLSETNTQYYNPNPTPQDKVHVLVYVVSANTPELMDSLVEKMKEFRKLTRDLRIPQMAILTHIDELSDEIEKNVRNAFKMEYLRKKMSEFSSTVGIPINHIFPVKNYSYGNVEGDADMDTLILTSLKHMLNYGGDYLNTLK